MFGCRLQCVGACPLSLNSVSYVYRTYMLQMVANAPASSRRGLRIRAGACPAAGANTPALAPGRLITPTKEVHVAGAVPLHHLAVDDNWEFVPVHVLLPPPMRRHLSLVTY